MAIPPNPYPMPGPTPGPAAPNYQDTYPALGLSGLAQGFTHGLELGHDWGHQADELAMHGKQMENEADYRNAMLNSRQPLIASEVLKNTALGNAVAPKLALQTKAENDRDANVKAALVARKTAADAKGAKNLDSIATAYDALDKSAELGKNVLGDSAPASGLAAIPQEVQQMFPHVFATAPINKFNDQIKAAAIRTLSATPHARMTAEGLANEEKTIGGSGESNASLAAKIEQRKKELASSMGVTPKDVEAYRASKAAGSASAPTAVYSTPQAQAIKEQYAAGKMTKAQAGAALDALGGGQ